MSGARDLRDRAERARRLASRSTDDEAKAALRALAAELEEKATALEAASERFGDRD
jgi:hypothetical protein